MFTIMLFSMMGSGLAGLDRPVHKHAGRCQVKVGFAALPLAFVRCDVAAEHVGNEKQLESQL
jgi:hypothetical protein